MLLSIGYIILFIAKIGSTDEKGKGTILYNCIHFIYTTFFTVTKKSSPQDNDDDYDSLLKALLASKLGSKNWLLLSDLIDIDCFLIFDLKGDDDDDDDSDDISNFISNLQETIS